MLPICLAMATTNQQVVYAMTTPPHGVVQYEYYTHQMPQSTSTYTTSIPIPYGSSVPPPPTVVVAAAEQNGDGSVKHSSDEGIQLFPLITLYLATILVLCILWYQAILNGLF